MQKSLIQKLKNLPSKPGVYLFLTPGQSASGGKDKNNTVLYIGKAKDIKKRLSSYFPKIEISEPKNSTQQPLVRESFPHHNRTGKLTKCNAAKNMSSNKKLAPDKLIMLSQVTDLDYIITDTEAEALLLESNLIKKHQPKFNIILKDDKNYLYIKIDFKEEWPRIYTIRQPNFKDGNFYAGPYVSADSARQTLKLLARTFKFCTCKSFLKKPCLRYRLGWCLCPKKTKISNKKYREIFTQVKKFLKGQTSELINELKVEMKKASNIKKYEDAARFRDQIQAIQKTISHQKIISTKNENYDVISLARQDDLAAINLFQIREGKLLSKQNFLLEHAAQATNKKIVESFITQYYPTTQDTPKEIAVPVKSLANSDQWLVTIPQRGKKHQLLVLGQNNARDYLHQHSNIQTLNPSSNKKVLSELKSTLHLPTLPKRLEAFDISNIQGQNATGSMVVFTNGQPDKSEYRKFAINPRIYSGGANDVAMLAEVVSRRLKNPNWPKPDLILLDGGKPQLNAIKKIQAFKHSSIQAISLAKREEHIFLPNKKQPLILPPTSPVLQLLQRVRDEAHRFSHAYYLKRHKKSQTHSILDDIPGLGPKTKKKLLQKFGSVQKVKKATNKQLQKLIGKKMTEKIKEYL